MDDSTAPPKTCEQCGATLPPPRAGTTRRYCSDGCRYAANNAAYYAAHHEEARAYAVAYRAAHREEEQARAAAYYAEHREEARARSAAYDATHREERRARAVAYRAAHPEEHRARVAAWFAAHPDEGRAHVRNRRARQVAAPGTHTAADVAAQYIRQHGRCYWCGEKVKKAYHVDHVFPIIRGGSNGPENLVVACPTCNLRKNDKLPHEFSDRLC